MIAIDIVLASLIFLVFILAFRLLNRVGAINRLSTEYTA